MRHLTPAFALGALQGGKEIEQFLGAAETDGRHGLRWIAVSPGRTGVTVYVCDVEDVGTDTFLDITEFPPLDPDEETWGREFAVLPTPGEALDVAERELAADPQRWVNQGVVCDEYRDFRTARTTDPWGFGATWNRSAWCSPGCGSACGSSPTSSATATRPGRTATTCVLTSPRLRRGIPQHVGTTPGV